jgi:hypothetical protein
LVKTKFLSRLINGSDAAKTKALAYIDTMEARYKECMEEWITSFQDMLKFPKETPRFQRPLVFGMPPGH